MTTLTSYVVIYNEELLIRRCLESVAAISDEIIVIHDGPCDDNSLQIAREFTDKVIVGERSGFGEFHRVKAMNLATSEWLLQMDADEFLSKEAQAEIPALIKSDQLDGYRFLWKLWDGQKYFSDDGPFKAVLFRKAKMFYVSFPGTEMGTYGKIRNVPIHLEHRPHYDNYTLSVFYKKWMRWIKIHASFITESRSLEHFNATEEILEKIQNRKKLHLRYSGKLLAPAWFLFSSVKALMKHEYYKSIQGWKVSFLQGLYGYFLCIYVTKGKKV